MRNLSFIKRTLVSLLLGCLACLAALFAFEVLYNWLSTHTGYFLAACLGLSQAVLYKADLKKILVNTNSEEASQSSDSQATEEAEESATGNEANAEMPAAQQPTVGQPAAEQETIGDAFGREVDGDQEAETERFSD